MKKAIFFFTMICTLFLLPCSCGVLRRPLDNQVGLSQYLRETESSIRREDWTNAMESIKKAQKAWEKIKPLMQIDIDHDYVNDIETRFVSLKGYIETKNSSEALANVLIIQETWKSIGDM